jgi:hypothetical protein
MIALGSGMIALGSGMIALGSGMIALGSGMIAIGSGMIALGSEMGSHLLRHSIMHRQQWNDRHRQLNVIVTPSAFNRASPAVE